MMLPVSFSKATLDPMSVTHSQTYSMQQRSAARQAWTRPGITRSLLVIEQAAVLPVSMGRLVY